MEASILTARWALPIAGPPIENPRIRVEGGRIVEMAGGRAGGVVPDAATATLTPSHFREGSGGAEDVGDVVILPGFVNAHTHLELTAYAGVLPPSSLWEWLPRLVALRRSAADSDSRGTGFQRVKEPRTGKMPVPPDPVVPPEIVAAIAGARQSLTAGVTCVADISRNGRAFDALLDVPIRKVCFFELISGASEAPRDADQLRDMVQALAARTAGRDDVRVGVSPHALYTVDWNDLRRAAAMAGEADLLLTMHVAETPEEVRWLADHSGPLADFRARFPGLSAAAAPRGGAIDLLLRSGVMHQRPLLAHCNYLDDEQFALLRHGACSVVFCPRAHAFFGHDVGPAGHRWREMLAAGVNVCIGTDSLASNESLSVLDELRFLRRAAPDVDPMVLLAMGTLHGARALDWERDVGGLRPGGFADMVAIPTPRDMRADRLAAFVLDGDAPVARVWVGGREVQ